MKVEQSPTFRKSYKKLHKNQLKKVNNAIEQIIKNPEIGIQKKGDLIEIFVYKFDCINQQFLLAYSWSYKYRKLLLVGVHENFYKKLKR
jgi:mRNA interferase RelE/StbE